MSEKLDMAEAYYKVAEDLYRQAAWFRNVADHLSRQADWLCEENMREAAKREQEGKA